MRIKLPKIKLPKIKGLTIGKIIDTVNPIKNIVSADKLQRELTKKDNMRVQSPTFVANTPTTGGGSPTIPDYNSYKHFGYELFLKLPNVTFEQALKYSWWSKIALMAGALAYSLSKNKTVRRVLKLKRSYKRY